MKVRELISQRETIAIRSLFALAVLAIGALVLSIATRARAGDDEWQVESSEAESPQTQPAQDGSYVEQVPTRPAASPDAIRLAVAQPKTSGGPATPFNACGEEVVPALPEIRSVVGQINKVWLSHVKVYESVAGSFPHARPGGCIYYNPAALGMLLNTWMNIQDKKAVPPMLYAIFAHEVGHEVHRDFDPDRMKLTSVERELEADRFAGYTMSYLRIQPDDITTYFGLTGDDFAGAHDSHGSSDQRTTSFDHGWKLAESGSSEQSVVPATGLGHP
jgi:hypothetical protein